MTNDSAQTHEAESGQAMSDTGNAIGWGTLALINAGLAQGKNRSGLIWFLISVPLGPIATLILVLLGKLDK